MASDDKRKKPKSLPGPPPEPGQGWNEPEPDFDDTVAQAARVKKKIQAAPPNVWGKAHKFFDDVEKQLDAIVETVKRTRAVTPKQKKAFDNWEAAVDRWVANADEARGGGPKRERRGDDDDDDPDVVDDYDDDDDDEF